MGTRLAGKVAIVTGSASGERQGRAVASEIQTAGGHAVFQPLDVTRETDWVDTIRAVGQRYGRLDVLVNNAGRAGPLGRPVVEQTTEEGWDALIRGLAMFRRRRAHR